MNDSKLISLYQTFHPEDWKPLHKFIHSPFVNESKEIQKLFSYLQKQLPKNKPPLLKKTSVFAAIYGKQTSYNDVKIRQLMYRLLCLTEDYLLHQRQQQNKLQRQIDLATIYAQRNLKKHFDACIRNAHKLQTSDAHKNSDFYYQQYRLERVQSQFLEQQQDRKKEPNLQQVVDALDHFYLISKFKHSCAIYNYKNLFKVDYQVPLLEESLAYVAQHTWEELPALQLYHHSLLALKDTENEAHFYQLKQLLNTHYQVLPKNEIRDLYSVAINYCIKQLNSGNSHFIKEVFDLYKHALAKEVLLDDDHLSPWTYVNIVSIGLNLKEYDWVNDFIHTYKNALPPKYQEGHFAFSLAKLNYIQEKYPKVVQLLHQAEFDDVFLHLSSRTLLIQTYYELEEWEVLDSLLDSFKIYLLRKKGIGYHKDNYLNAVRFTKRVIHLNPYDKTKRAKLKTQIEDTKMVANKKWLLRLLEGMG